MKKLLLLTTTLMITVALSAQIIHIPDDYATIQEGIDAANQGDTVLVSDGTYYESLNFKGKAITLASNYLQYGDTNHINNTILFPDPLAHPDTGAVITLCNWEDSLSVICGFTITGGSGNRIDIPIMGSCVFGGGICCNASGAKIIYNKIIGNQVQSEDAAIGAGIASNESGSTWMVLRNNVIKDNITQSIDGYAWGGGVALNGKAIIQQNSIIGNHVLSETGYADGGGIFIQGHEAEEEDLLILNNDISHNVIEGNGENMGGGALIWFSKATISHNRINNNQILTDTFCYCLGAGISCRMTFGELTITDNLFQGNFISYEARQIGIGLYVYSPFDAVNIARNNFIENIGPANNGTNGWGGGAYIVEAEPGVQVTLDQNLLVGNMVQAGGGFGIANIRNCLITNNIFYGNSAYRGGGINIYQDNISDTSDILIINNTFYNNYASDLGGALRLSGEGNDNIISFNNIYWENEAGAFSNSNAISNGTTIDTILYVCFSDIKTDEIDRSWSGWENIDDDPLFCDDTCHISGGPCNNSGIGELEVQSIMYYAPDHDYDGDPRPQGAGWEIGADEILGQGIYNDNVKISSFKIKTNPNPTTAKTNIQYTIKERKEVSLILLNMQGGLVESIRLGEKPAGDHRHTLNLSHLPGGIYLLRLQAGEEAETAKVILLK